MSNTIRFLFSALILLIIVALSLTGCGGGTPQSSEQGLKMASLDSMPADVKSAPGAVQQAYQFAVANPDLMKQIPCYCGCGAMGHASNYACYVSGVGADGQITFDNHALGCSICVDITQDVMRMLRDGKSPQEARTYVDATYSKYGTSNIP